MSKLPQAVIFDLDGTLVDTAPDLIDTLRQIMQRHGLPDMEAAQLRQFIGGGARALIQRALIAANRPADDPLLDRFEQDFLTLYESQLAHLSRLFDGTRDVLDMLKDSQTLMAVCTNKRHDFARKILRAFEFDAYFAEVVGSGQSHKRKPDPEPLLYLLDRLKVDARQAVMVGDSIIDIETARAAHVAVLGVSFGYSATPIRELGADRYIDHWREMPQALSGMVSETSLP